jgi:hypothetical protein
MFILAAVIVLGGIARNVLWLSAMGLFFVGLGVLMVRLANKKSDPNNSEVLRELVHMPERIVLVEHITASSSTGHFRTHWLGINNAAGRKERIKVGAAEVVPLARSLAERCPNAHVEVPGFSRPA